VAGVGGGGLVCGGLAIGTGGGPRLALFSGRVARGMDSTDEEGSIDGMGGGNAREGVDSLLVAWFIAVPGISSSVSDPGLGDRIFAGTSAIGLVFGVCISR
jgi:hypothetical protein